jgi:hypothetical protein
MAPQYLNEKLIVDWLLYDRWVATSRRCGPLGRVVTGV